MSANTFLSAQGFDIGKSPYHPDKVETARELMVSIDAMGKKIVLPVDAIVADKIDDRSPILDLPLEDIEGDLKILDIGEKTIGIIKKILDKSKKVIWNGPLGYFSIPRFQIGTESVADHLKKSKDIKVSANDEVVSSLLK